jgi:hypothetical protein
MILGWSLGVLVAVPLLCVVYALAVEEASEREAVDLLFFPTFWGAIALQWGFWSLIMSLLALIHWVKDRRTHDVGVANSSFPADKAVNEQ